MIHYTKNMSIFVKNMIVTLIACIPAIIGYIIDTFYKTGGIGIMIGFMITITLILLIEHPFDWKR